MRRTRRPVPAPLEGVPDWWRGPVRKGNVCYPTKGEALRAFYHANHNQIDNWGGLQQRGSKGEFDAVNEKYDLRGKKRATNMAEAFWHAMPPGKPFCVDRIDLDALNDTAPGRQQPFELPYDVIEARAMQRHYEDLSGGRGRRRRTRRRR
jgi:hypothetical protein